MDEFIAVTHEALNRIKAAQTTGGDLHFGYSEIDRLYVATKVEHAGVTLPVSDLRSSDAFARAAAGVDVRGQWLTDVPYEAHVLHHQLSVRRDAAASFEAFRGLVNVRNPRGTFFPLVTHAPAIPEELAAHGVSEYVGWSVSDGQVTAIPLAVQASIHGIDRLRDQWPVKTLQERRVAVIGVGSIGGVTAHALAACGVGTLELVDPDRFLWHNTVRHVLGDESVGRLKVDGVRDLIEGRWPNTKVRAHGWDAVDEAHLLRGLLREVDVVVCAADGIAPRRTVSHLARRAGIPAILACVLHHGAVGEVLRLRPGSRHGCLLCQRESLRAAGAMDAEADQELDYGTGLAHQPMTAVGPDLWLVGEFAAKVAASTLLEASGRGDHRLPGEYAVLSLRAGNDLAAPFDAAHSGIVTWREPTPPRDDCPTCS